MTELPADGTLSNESDALPFDNVASAEPTPLPYARRQFLKMAGSPAVVSILAGCSDDGSDTPGDDAVSNPNSVDEWLSDTGNYDSMEDLTGRSTVTVEVGAQGNSGANAFAPAAIKISPETTVTWEWVNGHHNVVATDGTFDSGSPEQDATFSHTFDSPGTFYYYCDPHQSINMKGAIIVANDHTTQDDR